MAEAVAAAAAILTPYVENAEKIVNKYIKFLKHIHIDTYLLDKAMILNTTREKIEFREEGGLVPVYPGESRFILYDATLTNEYANLFPFSQLMFLFVVKYPKA